MKIVPDDTINTERKGKSNLFGPQTLTFSSFTARWAMMLYWKSYPQAVPLIGTRKRFTLLILPLSLIATPPNWWNEYWSISGLYPGRFWCLLGESWILAKKVQILLARTSEQTVVLAVFSIWEKRKPTTMDSFVNICSEIKKINHILKVQNWFWKFILILQIMAEIGISAAGTS